MPAFFLELFSEEIPARMQARAAEDLSRLFSEAAAALSPRGLRAFSGPRRIALAAEIDAGVAAHRSTERGPRASAPEQAIAGFLRKHGATRDALRREGDFWVLEKLAPAIPAARLIADAMPTLLRRFPWPKSMRWGGTSQFAWVRPLRRIVCLLDRAVLAFDLREGEDDGHGLASGDLTEGHRFLAPGAVAVASVEDWQETLRTRRVIVDAPARRAMIAEGIARLAAERGLSVVPDDPLLDEVAGLVEWPVPMLGRIDAAFMDLPPEVMQVSMRVNQRVFALRDAAGAMTPAFAFVANIEPDDGGAAIVAGNERVLRARFADARHFWDLDRRTKLAERVPALDGVTFHAKLGSQGDRVRRLVRLSRVIAPQVGADPELAARAALLAKADLTSGMVGEFPELQGVMGRYYALHDREDARVAAAVRDHYLLNAPLGASTDDAVTSAVAIADRLDQLTGFFSIDERPTGSGDPYALRRAALSLIRWVRDEEKRLSLRDLIFESFREYVFGAIKALGQTFDELMRIGDRVPGDLGEWAGLDRLLPLVNGPGRALFAYDGLIEKIPLRSELTSLDPDLSDRLDDRLWKIMHLVPEVMSDTEPELLALAELSGSGARESAIAKLAELDVPEDYRRPEYKLDAFLRGFLEALEWLKSSVAAKAIRDVLAFIIERLRVQLRAEGARHDVLAAVFAASDDDDIVRLLARTDALASLLGTEDGTNLLTAYRRAANILRIEEKKDGPHDGPPDRDRLREREERALADVLDVLEPAIHARLDAEDFSGAMRDMARLRAPLDAFFDRVTVNADDPDLRRNRLRLLARVRAVMNRVADFSKIEG